MGVQALLHDKGFSLQILSFELVCGGLPAPECADNPLKYKFRYHLQHDSRNTHICTYIHVCVNVHVHVYVSLHGLSLFCGRESL